MYQFENELEIFKFSNFQINNMTTQELHDQVLNKLKAEFTDAVISSEVQYDFPVITVSKSKLYDILKFLKTNTDLGFEYLTTACGIHYPDVKGKELGMVYQLHNMPKNLRIRIKCFTALSDAIYPTITTIWPSANWMEREAFDFFGLRFQGHPNLIRILNTEDFEGFPMRKEFPLEDQTREDKKDYMFGR